MKSKYPDILSVGETAEFLNVSRKEVRKMCRNGELEAIRAISGNGNWHIKSEQFIHLEGWDSYLEQQKHASIELAKFLFDELKNK